MRAPRATHLATAVDLRRQRNASDGDLGSRLHPAYRSPIGRLPAGRQAFRGLPFGLARATTARRWLLLDGEVVVDLRAAGPTSHVVVAHFCDAWRDPVVGRPADLPIGWVTPVGQPLARYTLELASGRSVEAIVRRRFEINEGIVGWGQGAFAAVPHVIDQPLDWFGPYPAMPPGGYAEPGHAGLLGILPGSWGPAQTGVSDSVPSPTGDIALWLYVMEVPGGTTDVARLRMEPLAALDAGGGVVVAAVTAFRGSASPLAIEPRRSLKIERAHGADVAVDLGQVFRRRPAPTPLQAAKRPFSSIVGWGTPRLDAGPAGATGSTGPTASTATATVVDLAMAADATIAVGEDLVPARDLPGDGRRKRFGAVTIESMPTPSRRLEVEIVDAATGEPMPARVRFLAADGRYLPPLGHRDEINPGLNEDTGADLILGGSIYAYVPGRFPIELPDGTVQVEVVRGFGYRPLVRSIEVDGELGRAPLVLPLESVAGPAGAGWIAVDAHVHFLSPTSALLQARAEGIAIANLLATQWGDHHTNGADLPVGVVADSSGQHLVVMGSENRQNVLGHIGLLGASQAVLPMSTAGPPEARMGDPLGWLMADWADAARGQGGLAVAVHFPLPYAEIAADIVAGKIDAVEMQALTPEIDGPSIREWYRFLNCGYRLPILGGTDKMSAEIPLGAIRTYARLDPDVPLSFEAWADAVRAGRTFVSSGSFVDLQVDGCGPGDEVKLGRGGGTVAVEVIASAAQPVIDGIELIHDGVVVAASSGHGGETARLSERIQVTKSGWLAARVTSREQIHSGFSTSMGAHSSPVYLDVPGKPAFAAEDAAAIGTIIDGARTWVETIASVGSPAERARLAAYMASSRATLDERVRERSRR
ncbi:MAG: hypothetical protein QOD78_1361 [Chloroflexota bacterium]|nr:hypothetical protein [Chloroflexota bacterium]